MGKTELTPTMMLGGGKLLVPFFSQVNDHSLTLNNHRNGIVLVFVYNFPFCACGLAFYLYPLPVKQMSR